jgi:acyl CoA:acetate/3-ketoacid CoA transferase alpha subunit
MLDKALCRYTANNFNTVMAKNAKLTIVEVRSVKRVL